MPTSRASKAEPGSLSSTTREEKERGPGNEVALALAVEDYDGFLIKPGQELKKECMFNEPKLIVIVFDREIRQVLHGTMSFDFLKI